MSVTIRRFVRSYMRTFVYSVGQEPAGKGTAGQGPGQRSQQLVRGVRRAFLLTITVTDSESLLPEIPELPNLEGPSAE